MSDSTINLSEIHDLIEKAGGMFSWAAETLEQVEAVLETIRKETPESRVRHLAELARDACEDRCQTFFDLRDEFNCKSDDLRALLCASK
ncbi:hypothetical protein SB783_34395 [Paraburkholderia sp. SIMBA_009]